MVRELPCLAAKLRLVHFLLTALLEVLALDLNDNTGVRAEVAELKTRGGVLAFVILNAGLVAGKEIARTADGMEITRAASVIGHHVSL